MFVLLASVLAIGVVTALAAKLVVVRWPAMPMAAQVFLSAAAAPVLAVLAFIVLTVLALNEPGPASARDGAGMVVFAGAFFLIYALIACVIVGLPTAAVSVNLFRQR